jgi:diaminopimelate epimerase
VIPFWKVEAIGNDFPLVHLADVDPSDLPALAVAMADRRFGIGGDGLLAVGMEEEDVRVRMFNPDGSEDFCGNGLRCAARHVHSLGWVGERFTMRHLDRMVPTSISAESICTILGGYSYNPADVPATVLVRDSVLPGFETVGPVSALTTGSTHLVVPRLPGSEAEFMSVSPRLEVAEFFPAKTSVIWSSELEPGVLRLRIWERAVGETLGCGTGSSAAAVDYARRTGFSGPVRVMNPGGEVGVSVSDGAITVCGEAREVYAGEWVASFLSPAR